jgi:hypothetical protein
MEMMDPEKKTKTQEVERKIKPDIKPKSSGTSGKTE